MSEFRFSSILFIVLVSVQLRAQPVQITASEGWLESACAKWEPVAGAESYNVYVNGEGITDRKIDDPLIRDYGTYFRADVLGLKPGTYTLRVVPVIDGAEGNGSETGALIVTSHDRTGYSFWNGRIPGAYQADGTLKEDAVILYITENSKDSISLDVAGANSNPCVGIQAILEGFKKGVDNRPLVVRLLGQITDPAYLDNGDIVIENDNNALSYITFEGVGEDAVADGWGIRVKNATNIEIRNIGLMNTNSSEGDDVGLQQDNDHIWVHHCDFFYGNAGSDEDQIKGDGALDCKKSTYVTVSYNHFWDTGKSNLLGLGEGTTSGLFITYHHNWYDHSDSRHPRVRYYSAHVYNNYYDGISKYGAGSTLGSSVFVEANYFRNCRYPMLISMQGSDVFDESSQSNDYSELPTFSREDGGIIKAFNNYMTGQQRFVPYGAEGYPNSSVDYDAYVASSREEQVGSSVVSAYGNNTYNNFDTDPSAIYVYEADSPGVAMEKVIQYAGRMNGGDFKWTFDNSVDDASSDVNVPLKEALTSYQTSLIAVQGDTIIYGGGPGVGAEGDELHNFTLSGLSSSFYEITGNLSDSKGTVSYEGLTLTRCLKIESITVITFSIDQEAAITLVFNDGFNGKIKINGTSYSAVDGVLTLNIPAGDYEITKDEVANLYFMGITFSSTGLDDRAVEDIRLYPNPVTDILIISSPCGYDRIHVYDQTGILAKVIRSGENTIDMSELSDGIYLVMLSGKQGVSQKIIIKE